MRLNVRSSLSAALYLCCLAHYAVAQQSQTASIVGQLKVNGALPNARIEVKLESRFVVVGVAYADMQGRFSFQDLPPNLYHIVVTDEDYYPVRVDAVISSVSAQNTIVSVDLRTKKKDAQRPLDESPAGGNPNMVDKDAMGKSFPKDAVNAFEKGVKLSNEGKQDAAIEKFEKALSIAPTFYQARNNLGSALLAKGDFEGARQQFEEVIKVQQADAAAYFNLGNVYLLTNRGGDCYRALQQGLKREPNSAKGQFLLGTLYARTGRYQEAEKQLEAVLQIDPTMSQVHLELVNLYLRQQQPQAAIAELTTFLTRFPHDRLAPKAKEVLTRLGGQPPQIER
jgi:tetratricopeptide (TPR) repeat protein